jgi:hypothetical protein
MQQETRSCRAYEQKPNIPSDLYYGVIPVNCANCWRWSVEEDKCRDIEYAKNRNDFELVESIRECVW